MPSPLAKRLQLLASALSVLVVAAGLAAALFWWRMRASLPQLDGERTVAGLAAPVTIERDALGVPSIHARSRIDAARALGFLHAQDRFFQMDLLRRTSAGELAELIGSDAVPIDMRNRIHGFRRIGEQAVAQLTPRERRVLEAYAEGVNAGLGALRAKPWEYVVLRTNPAPWRPVDTLLVSYSMWLDLQDERGTYEQTLGALREVVGQQGVDFFAPLGTRWDAPLDESRLQEPPLPPLRLKRDRRAGTGAPPGGSASLASGRDVVPGSNCFAVSGSHTTTGSAILENDMHLALRVPNIWYRAVISWEDDSGSKNRIVGVTLPGAPAVVAGSNGNIAWGFTNAYVDSSDIVVVETDSTVQALYRTVHGWPEIASRTETIKVRGGPDVPLSVLSTEWGPILRGPEDGHYFALRWVAHDPDATNLGIMELETAKDVGQAVGIAHEVGMPNQNLVVADSAGHIAWTLTGRIPKRVGFDGRFPVSWAYGDRRWDGWLSEADVPVVRDPQEGMIWTANQRMIGGEAVAKLGDGGYDTGARAQQIRDDLRLLLGGGRPVVPEEMLNTALDDRAVFLSRWQELLLETLSNDAVAERGSRGALRDVVRQWTGRAGVDSAAYRVVRAFRSQVAARALEPFFARAQSHYPSFDAGKLQFDDAVWRLVHEQPDALLNPEFGTWNELLLAAADSVTAEMSNSGLTPGQFTWGRRNTLEMRHPFSRFLPRLLSRMLDMPADELPGDSNMPRVQAPASGASERLVVSPGHEDQGLFQMPGGQCGNPLSPYYRAGHKAWVEGRPASLLPGPAAHVLTLHP